MQSSYSNNKYQIKALISGNQGMNKSIGKRWHALRSNIYLCTQIGQYNVNHPHVQPFLKCMFCADTWKLQLKILTWYHADKPNFVLPKLVRLSPKLP